jgi:hypothetical protein
LPSSALATRGIKALDTALNPISKALMMEKTFKAGENRVKKFTKQPI